MKDAAAALGRDPIDWVVTGGEDHALVATFPPGAELPKSWSVIGRVVDWPDVGEVPLVTISGLPSGAYTGPGGWRHFSTDTGSGG